MEKENKMYSKTIYLSEYEKAIFYRLENLPNKNIYQKMLCFIDLHGAFLVIFSGMLVYLSILFFDQPFSILLWILAIFIFLFLSVREEEKIRNKKMLKTIKEIADELYSMKKTSYSYHSNIDDMIDFFQKHKQDEKGCYGYFKLKEEIQLLKSKEIFEAEKGKTEFYNKILNS